jgi:hypothetical protein
METPVRQLVVAAGAALAITLTVPVQASAMAAGLATIGDGTATSSGEISLSFTYACESGTGAIATFDGTYDGSDGYNRFAGTSDRLTCDDDLHSGTAILRRLGNARAYQGQSVQITGTLVDTVQAGFIPPVLTKQIVLS